MEQAYADWGWTQHLFAQGASYLVCFLAQQVAEKALKALLDAQGEEVVLGHAVRQLCHSAARYDAVFRDRLDEWGVRYYRQ